MLVNEGSRRQGISTQMLKDALDHAGNPQTVIATPGGVNAAILKSGGGVEATPFFMSMRSLGYEGAPPSTGGAADPDTSV